MPPVFEKKTPTPAPKPLEGTPLVDAPSNIHDPSKGYEEQRAAVDPDDQPSFDEQVAGLTPEAGVNGFAEGFTASDTYKKTGSRGRGRSRYSTYEQCDKGERSCNVGPGYKGYKEARWQHAVKLIRHLQKAGYAFGISSRRVNGKEEDAIFLKKDEKSPSKWWSGDTFIPWAKKEMLRTAEGKTKAERARNYGKSLSDTTVAYIEWFEDKYYVPMTKMQAYHEDDKVYLNNGEMMQEAYNKAAKQARKSLTPMLLIAAGIGLVASGAGFALLAATEGTAALALLIARGADVGIRLAMFGKSLHSHLTGNKYVRKHTHAWMRKILRHTILQSTTLTRFFSETGHSAPFMVRNAVLQNVDRCYGE